MWYDPSELTERKTSSIYYPHQQRNKSNAKPVMGPVAQAKTIMGRRKFAELSLLRVISCREDSVCVDPIFLILYKKEKKYHLLNFDMK